MEMIVTLSISKKKLLAAEVKKSGAGEGLGALLFLSGAGNFLSNVPSKNPAPENNQSGAGEETSLLRTHALPLRRRKFPCPAFDKLSGAGGPPARRRKGNMPSPAPLMPFRRRKTPFPAPQGVRRRLTGGSAPVGALCFFESVYP